MRWMLLIDMGLVGIELANRASLDDTDFDRDVADDDVVAAAVILDYHYPVAQSR